METITIVVTETTMTVLDGRVRGSRHTYHAPGLDIYVKGRITVIQQDVLLNLTLNECAARHIPLLALRRVRSTAKSKAAISDPFLANMFDRLTDEERGQMRHECGMCGKYCSHVDDNGHCASCAQIWSS